jgi:nucleoside-diphosphate-sugar epimerase
VKALVTGAAGFLGSHIVDRLRERGDQVRVLVRSSSDLSYLQTLPDVELLSGDITSADAVRAATRGVDVVYHSAARVSDHGSRAQFMAANVDATRLLLDACRENRVPRFLFVSSPSVVMDGGDQVRVDERQPYPKRFLNLYSETKALAEQLVLRENGNGLFTCSIRPRAVWGPRDKTGWFPKIFARLAQGRLPDLSGGRRVEASFTFCSDAAEACILASQSDQAAGKAYFVSDGLETDVWEFARLVCAKFSLAPPSRKVSPAAARALARTLDLAWKLPALGHHSAPPLSEYVVCLLTRTGTYDIGAAQRDFGYRPRVDHAHGLSLLGAWIDRIGGTAAFTGQAS